MAELTIRVYCITFVICQNGPRNTFPAELIKILTILGSGCDALLHASR